MDVAWSNPILWATLSDLGDMQRFEGQLWLLPDYSSELNVEILLDEGRIRVFSGWTLIGNWKLDEVDMELREGHVFMRVEGEELIVRSTDPEFAPALTGQDVEDSNEPYIPYESPSRGRSERNSRKWT